MATSKHTTKLTRRAAVKGGVSVIALAGAAGAVVAAVPTVDPHPAWLERRETKTAEQCRLFRRLEKRYGGDFNFPPGVAASWNRRDRAWLEEYYRLTGLLIDTPAYTPEGISTKAYLLWAEGYIGSTGQGEKIACSLIADLQRMATRPLTDFEACGFAKARAVFGDKTPVQEYRALTDEVTRIAGRLGELHPQLSGRWIKKS